MTRRILLAILLSTLCSACESKPDRTLEVSAGQLAEIKSKPYIGGNGPGGFAAAALTGVGDESTPEGILFTGFGPYLHELGFNNRVMITSINGVGVGDIFYDRWATLRLQDPAAYDAAHYKDLIEYLFAGEPGDSVDINVDINVTVSSVVSGDYVPEKALWRIEFKP